MSRILADLPEDDIEWLDQQAAEQGKSRPLILSVIVKWYRQQIEERPCES